MGFRILGAPEETVLLSLQGDVTLSLTPASGLTFNSFAPVSDPPRLSDWDNYIDTYGPTHAANYREWGNYDGNMVNRFLANYTGETATYMPASDAIRDDYWLYCGQLDTGPVAYKMYSNGLYHSAVEDGFPAGSGLGGYETVATAFAAWADRNSYTHQNHTSHYHQTYSREVALNLQSMVRGEQLVGASQFNSMLGYSGNYPLDMRYGHLLGKAENHLRQWRDNDFTNPSRGSGSEYVFMTPFMVGITCYALALYYEQRGNDNWQSSNWADIPTAVEDVLTWMYDEAPNHAEGGRLLFTDQAGAGTYDAFPYVDRSGSQEGGNTSDPAPGLNMIIAPAYAWLGKHYNDSTYVTNYADRLFGGAAYLMTTGEGGWIAENTNKQYNQFFYWANEYFIWRQQV